MVAEERTSARVDAWLWAVRVYKTRSAATAACRAGHVRVNGERVKAAQTIRPGDEIRTRIEGWERIVTVRRILVKRVGAPEAATALTDTSPPPPKREELLYIPLRDRGTGRPTKRDRRDMDRMRETMFGEPTGPDETDD